MSDYEAFVHELIGYIFKVQDKEDDNLSAEVICRELYKHGLIERANHEWRMKYRPRYRWPARICKDKPQTERSAIVEMQYNAEELAKEIKRITNMIQKEWEVKHTDINVETMSCQECKHYVYQLGCTHHGNCSYEPKDEAQMERECE